MEQNSNFIEKIADRMIFGGDTVWGMNIQGFDWVPGVGLYGIWKAWEVTRQEKYLNFLKDRLSHLPSHRLSHVSEREPLPNRLPRSPQRRS